MLSEVKFEGFENIENGSETATDEFAIEFKRAPIGVKYCACKLNADNKQLIKQKSSVFSKMVNLKNIYFVKFKRSFSLFAEKYEIVSNK